ncbi:phospholipase D-like domain-containing protein [Alicyclobacillus tolerans]|uniref:phospholipase D-like domain-containing protein n=1 Tax=Alicyclobacillus tolerans TaxID=90970 RepID=UPI001F3F068A|nr:phospholipase D-like domain-containing protein [Alicyclobacillus tolerans]MCF8567362.1 phospholipase D-like domain-containing protein [Alicyclobacillus tolerans]
MLWNQTIGNGSSEKIINHFLEENEGIVVLDSVDWEIPCDILTIPFDVKRIHDLSFIELHICRILNTMMQRFQTKVAIADILQTSSVFVEHYLSFMVQNRLVELSSDTYHLTTKGLTALSKGQVTITDRHYATVIYEKQFNTYYPPSIMESGTDDNEVVPFRHLNGSSIHTENPPLRELFSMATIQPDMNTKFSEIVFEEVEERSVEPAQFSLRFLEFWVYDTVASKVFCRVWDYQREEFRPDIEAFLNEKDGVERTSQVPSYSPITIEIFQQAKSAQKSKRTQGASKTSGTVLLRGRQIREAFLTTFKDAKHRILIISPWMTDQVVDDELINLFKATAKRGVTIHIGWGIAKIKKQEDRLPSDDLLLKLAKIKNAEGHQAVFVHWIGNHHNKEIVVDDKYLLLGSYNWLSYRGDYQLRNESVCKVFEEEPILETTKLIESEFVKSISRDILNGDDLQQCLNLTRELCILDNKALGSKVLEKTIKQLAKDEKRQWIDEMHSVMDGYGIFSEI